jgi:hypothetical protein
MRTAAPLAAAVIIVVAVVIRGWPRRRRDRWRVTFEIERDRSDPPDEPPEAPAG